jgi:P-type Ca2+ transporter type 2C
MMKTEETAKNIPWHTSSVSDIEQVLNTSATSGLDAKYAAERLAQVGLNELVEQGRKNPLRLLLSQFTSTLVLILIAAAVVSAFLGKTTETVAIAAIVVLFGLLGFFQEYQAEKAIAALKELAVPNVRAKRDGIAVEISATDLVPGDLVLLEAGNLVPSDMRLVESVNLSIQEAALTGESEAVAKQIQPIDNPELALGDRLNMAYLGTQVTVGRGAGLVVETGMRTELGKIATLIQEVKPELTPLQRQLDQVGKSLAALGIGIAALMLVIGVLRGETLAEMLLTAISIAVAVVPEGLPAVVTVTLALGAQRMLRRNALVRKLPAVETLGSVTVICSDKTGTLTENRMTVTVVDVAGHYLELAGTNRHPAPSLRTELDTPPTLAGKPPAVALTLAAGALCNDASLSPDPQTGRYTFLGDPTEGALLVAAAQAGLDKDQLGKALPRINEIPFDSDRKRMSTMHRLRQNGAELPQELGIIGQLEVPVILLTKGSVDGLLELATHLWVDERIIPMDESWRQRIQSANDQMAKNGMRVLGITIRALEEAEISLIDELENQLIFIGMVGMIDPPRPEVRQAVATARAAGIRPVMITGDHPLTARFIAYDLGISTNGRVKTGKDLDRMDSSELEKIVGEVSVYARVSPEHKLRIVEVLQRQNQVVAMTGDGVNDAPALKKADIGIAMGITGTDVSKEASEMVLTDDNFATIVAAVEEGRVIYENIRRFVKFSIAGNVGKVLVMLLSPLLLGINVALLPLQLLWLNLLTDGLLGLGLGVEPAEPGTMKLPPRSTTAGIFSGGLVRHVGWVGVLIAAVSLVVAAFYYDPANPESGSWQTMIFTTLAFLQIGQALASRSSRESFFRQGLRSNLPLTALAILVFMLQLLAVYAPAMDDFFNIVPLTPIELLICMLAGSVVFAAIELEKLILRRRDQHTRP